MRIGACRFVNHQHKPINLLSYLQEKKCVWKLHCGGAVLSSPCLSLLPHHLYVATLGGLLLAVNPVGIKYVLTLLPIFKCFIFAIRSSF